MFGFSHTACVSIIFMTDTTSFLHFWRIFTHCLRLHRKMGLFIFVSTAYQKLEPQLPKDLSKKSGVLAPNFHRSYSRYKDKKPHFEISVKLRIF
jgi:hypothetical protein